MVANIDDSRPIKTKEARSAKPLRGARFLASGDRLFSGLDRAIEKGLPTRFNPLTQTGAMAVASFVVAVVSGVLLLVWYRPSAHQAYESVMAMEASTVGSFVRTLHRYSSDACLFFTLIHGLRLFFGGRFTGARWLAWVTGIVSVAVLWFIGWTGYWLVWDQPAQLVAQGTAMMADVIPVFGEPLSRSFLADELVPSLIFFVIFFAHMLIPLVMAVILWIHVGRVQRAQVWTVPWMSLWTVGSLMVLSVLVPASAGAPANASVMPGELSIDLWYLWPLWLSDRLGPGLLWALCIGTGALLVSMPWWMKRGPTRVAVVDTKKCNGCTLCARDCPYDAIVMVPREDGRRWDLQAELDTDKCVGCGICAGSCNPGGIGLDWLPVQPMRRRFDDWIDETCRRSEDGQGPVLAFLCADSAAEDLRIDPVTGHCDSLPGYRVMGVPCTGWVQPLTVERALRRGARGVLIVGCSDGHAHYREGHQWTKLRLDGRRKPSFRADKMPRNRVRYATWDRSRPRGLIRDADAFRRALQEGESQGNEAGVKGRSRPMMVASGVAMSAAVALLLVAGSVAPYPGPPQIEPRLVVSMNHAGALVKECVPIPEEEQAQQPAHMQQSERCERRRSDVRMQVEVDGEVVLDEEVRPRGIRADGPSVNLERFSIPEGGAEVVMRIDDNGDGDWNHVDSRWVDLEKGQQHSILYDTHEGFRSFGPSDGES